MACRLVGAKPLSEPMLDTVHKIACGVKTKQLGAAANFDDLVKFGDRRQFRRSQMFIKLAFEFGCDVILMSHPITQSLGNKHLFSPWSIHFSQTKLVQSDSQLF